VRYLTRDGKILSSSLWVTNLATGRKKDLGSVGGGEPFWQGNLAVITAAGPALESVDVATGHKSVLMTTADPRVIRGYRATLPRAGRPGDLEPIGFGTGQDSSTIAAIVESKKPITSTTGQPPPPPSMTVALIRPGRVDFPAARLRPVNFVSLNWGPRGLFAAETIGPSVVTPIPPAGAVYTGSGFAPPLSEVRSLNDAQDNTLFNPQGTVIGAEMADGNWRFATVPDPQCQLSAHCFRFKPLTIAGPGTFLDWTS
jgi:hypothetical protein